MKIIKGLFFSLTLLVLTSCSDDDEAVSGSMETYIATLDEINNSGASGTASLILEDNELTVVVEAQGMTPDMEHPQHIHGFTDASKNATCPPASADTDEDGIITIPEGAPFYGEVLLPLKDFPIANENGFITYQKTFTLGMDGMPTKEEIAQLENKVIVLHGLDKDGSYVATIPVACGKIIMN